MAHESQKRTQMGEAASRERGQFFGGMVKHIKSLSSRRFLKCGDGSNIVILVVYIPIIPIYISCDLFTSSRRSAVLLQSVNSFSRDDLSISMWLSIS